MVATGAAAAGNNWLMVHDIMVVMVNETNGTVPLSG
jgi:hypothetical protein